MKKRVLASLLSTAMAVTLLAGCGSGSSSSGGSSAAADSAQPAASTTAAATEASSAGTQEASGEPDEIVFAYMTQNNIPESSDLQRIENLINAYTVDKINTKVHLLLFSNSDYMNQVNLMLASGEQIDIFCAQGTSRLPYIKDGTALDITDYFDNELKETKDIVYDDFLKPTTVDGRIYGILNMGSNYVPAGFCYRTDIANELGIDIDSVKTFTDLTDVFAKVKAAYPDMIIIDPNRANALQQGYLGRDLQIDPLGDIIESTVSGVAKQDDPTVVNMYTTDEYITLAKLCRSWYEAGYFASDAATTTATTAELLMSGNCFGTFCGLGNPKIAKQYTTNYGYPFDNFVLSGSSVWAGSDGGWMVNSSTESPSAACKFLNLLYTDSYIDNLLVYGEEGTDYVLNDDGCAEAPDGYTDLNSVPYTDNMDYYYWGNKWLTYPVVGGLVGDEMETQKQLNYDAPRSRYYGFMYDYSSLEAEYTACTNIVGEYKKSLWVGASDVDSTLKEMNERLEAAGMNKLIELKQQQLDEWLAQQ